ncbi:MAG: SDR family NAD(P)-dependent oxidoreductase [Haloferacaceae archaeon]
MTLDGTGALVTGGSGAIGRAIVAELATAGAAVTVAYHTDEAAAERAAAEARERAGRARTAQADLTDPDAAERLVDEATDFAPLGVLVNSAGYTAPAAVEDLDPETVRRTLAVNVEGAINAARAAVPALRERGGVVVNVSSVAAEIGSVDVSYATAKAGLLGFTRALARELGEDGARANAVVPGPVDTPMNDEIVEFLEERRFRGHRTVDTLLDRYEAQPEEVADAVRFLVANEFVTGETLHVDGGMQL